MRIHPNASNPIGPVSAQTSKYSLCARYGMTFRPAANSTRSALRYPGRRYSNPPTPTPPAGWSAIILRISFQMSDR